jgi:hypothetical protein
MILLPGNYEFSETLANLPFFYKGLASQTCETMHILQKNPNHLPEMVNVNSLQEYLLGGEADQYIEYIDGYADANDLEESDDCLDLWELGDEWLGSI